MIGYEIPDLATCLHSAPCDCGRTTTVTQLTPEEVAELENDTCVDCGERLVDCDCDSICCIDAGTEFCECWGDE